MTEPSAKTMSPRRLLAIILAASIISLICGLIAASLIFKVADLNLKRPFLPLYENGSPPGLWRPVSQYMLCASIQLLTEVQTRSVERQLIQLKSLIKKSTNEATRLNNEATLLQQQGDTAQAQQLLSQEKQAKLRSSQLQLEVQRLIKLNPDKIYITRYYKLIFIPIFILWVAVWLTAAYIPRELRFTNQIVKIGALVGLFHGALLGLLIFLWAMLGGSSLRSFYTIANFYHGQWTGLWLYPSVGVVLTGYLFGTLAGWFAKAAEQTRFRLIGNLTSKSRT